VPSYTKRYVTKQVSGNSRGQTVVRKILDLETHPARTSSEITAVTTTLFSCRRKTSAYCPRTFSG
jgi:hypothetical protein